MIGNDIVDLKVASIESDWKRDRFLNKLFTVSEQKMIQSAEKPSHIIWLLWSMKESAYKIFSRQFKKRFFAPLNFVCELDSANKGTVTALNKTYLTESIYNQNFIYTTARINKASKITSSYFGSYKTTYKHQHQEVYSKLLKSLSEIFKTPTHLLEIRKDGYGAPRVYQNNRALSVEISISHHGQYGAFCISGVSQNIVDRT
jgi:phosphopantetheine--protein transferase-like protein